MPTTPSDRRVLAATLAVLAATGCSLGDDPTPAPPEEQETVPELGAAPDVVLGLTDALERRADAVRRDDRNAFLAGLDASDPAFRRDQATYLGNLAQLPLGQFGYALDPATLTREGRRYWVVVDVTLELEGYDEVPVVTRDRYRFTRRGGHYLLSSVTDPTWESEHGDRAQPWDEEPVTIRYGSGVLGIFDAGSEPYAGDVVADVESGIADVSARVPYAWEPRVVVYALSDPTFLAGLEDVPGDDPLALDAVAFPVPAGPDGEETADTRFLLNPRMLDVTGPARDRLIRHELTHVALGSRADGVPTWLSEGIAEYVSVRPLAPEDRVLSPAALEAAEDGLTGLPDDDAFTGADREVAYGVAWWACEYLAETYDDEMLWFLLESMATSDDPDQVLETVVQLEPDELARKAGRLMLATYRPDPPEGGSPEESPTE
jgi:hypothetical protein